MERTPTRPNPHQPPHPPRTRPRSLTELTTRVKYLTKTIGQAAGLGDHATDAHRDHARRLHAELSVTPCSPRCPLWLLYGIQPQGARHSMTPGRCKGKAHQPQHLGIAGRRVLVSRKWSNKTLEDHRAERSEFVRQLLQAAGIQPAHGP
ncbi:MAG: replication initiator [Mycobacterium sp.]